MDMMLTYFLLASLAFVSIEGACEFPAELRGYDWYTTSNGKVTIPSDGSTIVNFESAIQSATFTLTCSEYDNDTDRYISTVQFKLFSAVDNFKAFFCMKFTKITSMKYIMTYDTNIDSTSLVRVIVINNVTGTLTPSQACALTSSQPVGTQELLVRSDAVSPSAISCPASIQYYLSATIQSSGCVENYIDGTAKASQHTYTYASCVTSKYTSGGKFDCMYSVTEEPYTYLTVFNNDTTVDESATFRYLCYVIWSYGHVVYYTYHPQICQPLQTPIRTATDGVAVVASNNMSNDVGSQIAVGVILSLLLLALIVLTIVLLVLFLLGQRRQKAVRIIEEKKVRKSKSESKSKSSDGKAKHDEKKKHKKTKKKKTDNEQKTDQNQNMNVSLRRTESMKEKAKETKLKWTDFVGISGNVNGFDKPQWQVRWEQHRDPDWTKSISYEDSETARSTDSITSTSKIIWVTPEKEELETARSLWERVYRLWYEPRKTIPDNKFQEMQKLTKLSMPKHVRFKGNDK
ncbi:uncharacterized protein LOC143084955 [Mytilus galloprovincialis]|uniref:uncharacterized protein LOC143084955 n=1 Tax=Mytilus galloprovincialis TaxID=29158 RepID=UPI003F7BFB65